MNLRGLLNETFLKLESNGSQEAYIEAELLVMKAVGITRPTLYAFPERLVTTQASKTLKEDLDRRLSGEPWAYISGFREFYGVKFSVNPGVFIPRPETELIVDLAVQFANDMNLTNNALDIADIGTGTGAIAIATSLQLPKASIYAIDISNKALENARSNCEMHQVQDRVTLLEGNLLEPLNTNVDIIISNPPYIPRNDIVDLPIEVRQEPLESLDGGLDGLDFIRTILRDGLQKLRVPGAFILEFSPLQASEMHILCNDMLNMYNWQISQDLASRDRILSVQVT